VLCGLNYEKSRSHYASFKRIGEREDNTLVFGIPKIIDVLYQQPDVRKSSSEFKFVIFVNETRQQRNLICYWEPEIIK
jgi:hypothetical protein